jgi:hypothetical protein
VPEDHAPDWGTAHPTPDAARTAVAHQLMHGRSLLFTALACRVPSTTVLQFAEQLGWPDTDRVREEARSVVSAADHPANRPDHPVTPRPGGIVDQRGLQKRHQRVAAAREALAAADRTWADVLAWAVSTDIPQSAMGTFNPTLVDNYLTHLEDPP